MDQPFTDPPTNVVWFGKEFDCVRLSLSQVSQLRGTMSHVSATTKLKLKVKKLQLESIKWMLTGPFTC